MPKANVKVTGLPQIKSNIRKFIIKGLRDKEVRQNIGNIVATDIQNTTFRTAPKKTQNQRKYLEKYNATHPTYKRTKINVTFTGELMDDLRKNVKVESKGGLFSFIIAQSDKLHKKYNGKKKKIGKKRSKYSDISDGLINKRNIKYLDIKKETLDRVLSFINKQLIKAFKGFK